MAVNCPICKEPSGIIGDSKSFPFCSKECKRKDLDNWLSEKYMIPESIGESQEEEDVVEEFDYLLES